MEIGSPLTLPFSQKMSFLRVRSLFIAIPLILLLLQWELAGLDLLEMFAALPGVSFVYQHLSVPAVFRNSGFDAPSSVQDGIKCLEAISKFPLNARFKKRRTATMALAMPVIGRQFAGSLLVSLFLTTSHHPQDLLENLELLLAFKLANATQSFFQVVAFYPLSEVDFEAEDGAQDFVAKFHHLCILLTGDEGKIVYSSLTPLESRYTWYSSAGPVNQFVHIVQCLHHAGFSSFFLLEVGFSFVFSLLVMLFFSRDHQA